MKVMRTITVGAVSLAMVFAWMACGGTSGGGEAYTSTFNLSAKQGPNKKVIEPETVLNAVPTANFFLLSQDDAAKKAGEILTLALGITEPGTTTTFLPHNIVLDTIFLGLTMGNIAADESIPATSACDELDNELLTLTGGTPGSECYNILNCSIIPPDANGKGGKGNAKVDFGSVAGCSYSLTGNESIGTITVRGKLLDPLYPAYNPFGNLTYDCSDPASDCKDVKVAAVSDNFGIYVDGVNDDVFTAKSAIVGYVFNYDLTTKPDLADLPIFIVGNVQFNDDNMALAIAMPGGIRDIANSFYGGVIDADGLIYGVNNTNVPPQRIQISTLPLQVGGTFCQSTFNDDGAGTYTLDGANSDDCGLCTGLSIDTTTGVATCP